MPPGIGYSFQPGASDTPFQRNQDSGGPTTTAPQQAIRTLSLRVPQTTSVPGIAPLPLLNAKGGGGTDLDMLLTALLRAFGPQSGPTGSTPRVRPIDDPNQPMPVSNLADHIPQGRLDELRRRTGGPGGIGDTGRTQDPLSPTPIGNDVLPPQFSMHNVQPLF